MIRSVRIYGYYLDHPLPDGTQTSYRKLVALVNEK